MARSRLSLLVAATMLLALTACARVGAPTTSGGASPLESGRPTRTTGPIETVPPGSPGGVEEVPDAILQPILDDAADRSGVPPEELEVVRAEAVVWPDGSLGCPEPGTMYTQALVDGYWVVVDADGTELDYRIGSSGSFRLCEGDERPTGS